MKVLPENVLKCLSAADRRQIGQKTAGEAYSAGIARSEKELQKQIVSLLRLKGIEVNVSRMDKRKTDRVGWPDLTFATIKNDWTQPIPHAWEIKLPSGKLSPEQEQLRVRLTSWPNCWRYRVIHSVDEALKELREMGIM